MVKNYFPAAPTQSRPDIPAEAAPPADVAPINFDPEFVIRLRRHKSGNFSNLWECTMLDPKACRSIPVIQVLDDANALNFVIENIQGKIEDEGF